MKPYVYKIVSKNSEFYYGVRWCYNGTPESDLWINYFTSSSLIHELIRNKGKEYFTADVIKVLSTNKEALDYEYSLIKESIDDDLCLNRALGKCTIWDDKLKNKVSKSVKKLWDDPSYKENQIKKHIGKLNHNYNLPSWRNVNSDIESWLKVPIIYNDYINEKWDLKKYGFGRYFLIKRYNIKQGTARSLLKKLISDWNPHEDIDFIKFLEENNKVG